MLELTSQSVPRGDDTPRGITHSEHLRQGYSPFLRCQALRSFHQAAPAALLALLALLCPTVAPARADPLRVDARISPERLGSAVAVAVCYEIPDPPASVPSPLLSMSISLPAGLSVATSELGLANCRPAQLEAFGPTACPRDSLIARGGATTVLPFGLELVHEHVALHLYAAGLLEEDPRVAILATGAHPVIASVPFAAVIRPATGGYGSTIAVTMPPVPGLPGGPDVAVTHMSIAIGYRSLTYTERVHGRTVRFHPQGIILPTRCPRGGFRFAVTLTFLNGAAETGKADVSCPRAGR